MPINIVINDTANINVSLGVPGPAATVQVGTTETLPAGSSATVTNSGSITDGIFNFGIPQGIKGEQGIQGIQGIQGAPGQKGDKGDQGNTGAGVAPGGLEGQVLAKINSVDYNTEWINVADISAVWGQITGTLSNQIDLQNVLDSKLSLTGGSLSGDVVIYDPTNEDNYIRVSKQAIDIYKSGIGNVIELAEWGLGVSDTNGGSGGHTSEVRPDAIWIKTDNVGITLTSSAITFADSTIQTTAGLPLIGGIMSGAIRFDSVGTQNISKGSFDSGRGGYNGISLNCAAGYEINWQAGYLKALNNSNAVVPINVDNSDLTLIKTIPADIDYPEYTTTTTLTGIGILNSFTIPDNWSAGWGIGQDKVGGYGANSGVNTWECGSGGVKGFDGTYNWGLGVDGLKFASDGSVQTTAGLPLTGGTVTGGITLTGAYENPAGQITFTDTAGSGFNTIYNGVGINFGNGNYWAWDEGIHADGISGYNINVSGVLTFADNSQQTTAFIPQGVSGPPDGAVYPNELLITINGVQYAMPVRVV